MTQVITEQGDLGLGVYDYPETSIDESQKDEEDKEKDKK